MERSVTWEFFPRQFQILSTSATSTQTAASDLIYRVPATGEFFTWLSNGNSFSAPISLGISPANASVRHQLVGDINGDGASDIAFQDSNSGVFYTGRIVNGSFLFRQATRWNASVELRDVMLGDFTDDGQDDLVFRVQRSGRVWLGESNGARFRLHQTALLEKNVDYDSVMKGDFAGDGPAADRCSQSRNEPNRDANAIGVAQRF